MCDRFPRSVSRSNEQHLRVYDHRTTQQLDIKSRERGGIYVKADRGQCITLIVVDAFNSWYDKQQWMKWYLPYPVNECVCSIYSTMRAGGVGSILDRVRRKDKSRPWSRAVVGKRRDTNIQVD